MNDSLRKTPASGPDDMLQDDLRASLSALVDGQADALTQGCKAWREDAKARQTWHAYHLIGDVLRSGDLAQRPSHDEAFLARLRDRLVAEPVVLAPAAAKPHRLAWRVPAAVAAGFIVVAGVMVVSRMSPPADAAGGVVAAASRPALTLVGDGATAVPATRLGEGAVIRNPRLDEYLRAHQSARGGVPVAVPGGGLRRVEAIGTVMPAGATR
jgi:sigma-E factor negative regulatory protein RseA